MATTQQFSLVILGFVALWMFPLTVVSFGTAIPTRGRAFCGPAFRTTALTASVDISTPSPEEAANLGVRDWPQQLKKGAWTEQVGGGQTVVRYVLDGTGIVETTTSDETGTDKKQRTSVGPGSLMEVAGEASLSWEASSGEMIILTPGYEEGGKLLGVAVAMVVLCGALVAGVGGS
jgi:hypothetical protein